MNIAASVFTGKFTAAGHPIYAEREIPSAATAPEQGKAPGVAAVAAGSGCGMCAHWKQTTRFNRPPFGMCMWRPDKRPAWFTTENSTMLFETDGKTCETFTPNGATQTRPAEPLKP